MSFLTGKSKSENKAFPWLQSTFANQAADLTNRGAWTVNRAQNFLTGGDMQGFDAYRQSTGYQNIFDEAMRGVTSNAAARGLLSSGATVRAAQDRAGQLAQQQYDNYLRNLLGVSGAQLQGGSNLAGMITQAGQTSTQRGGLLDAIGSIGSAIGGAAMLSDIRAKENIVKLGEEPDGLGIYEFNYIGQSERHIGVMAQEVAQLRPHALGPVVDGYMTVNYGAL